MARRMLACVCLIAIMTGKLKQRGDNGVALNAKIDEEFIEAYLGKVFLLFGIGDNERIAVKIVDDRGIESLKILEVC
ncbi:MAG: hypothetical protein SV375_16435 [Thermodesulfobacteriota bacterium]|nr:hypothetical protein [Thermodesulfobacteriota bacterium]